MSNMSNETYQSEDWRPVVGYEGVYEVSTHGRVRSVDRRQLCESGFEKTYQGRILSPFYSKKGYASVTISVSGRHKNIMVHRMVAEAFIANPKHLPCVDHVDTNVNNNHVENLRWCTQIQNSHNPITRKHFVDSVSRSVIRVDKEGNTKKYQRLMDVKSDGFSPTKVCVCCRRTKGRYFHRGYAWYYDGDEPISYADCLTAKNQSLREMSRKRRRPLLAYNDTQTKEFARHIDAKREGFDTRKIYKSIKDGSDYKNFRWAYK